MKTDSIKRQLTGNRGNDVDVIAGHFREKLKDTDIGKNEKVLDAMSKASAEIMVGFAKASGLTGNEYYDTIRGFLYGVKSPDNAYKSDIDDTIFAGSAYEARMVLKAIQGSSIVNENDGSTARISSTSIGKLLSNKALNKSLDNGFTRTEHDTAAANIDTLFKKSIRTLSRQDRKGSEHIAGIHYYSTDVIFQDTGREGTAEIMVKESVQNGQMIYTMELVGLKTRDPLASRMGNQSENQLARSQGLSIVILPSAPKHSNGIVLGSKNDDGYISIMENSEPIRVESPDIDYSLDKSGMQSAIRSWASGHSIASVPYINADTGISITAYRKAVDEITRHGVGIDTDVRYKSVAFIPEIIKKRKYIGSAPNTDIRVDAEFFDYFIAPIEIDGTEYIVTAATAEMNNVLRLQANKERGHHSECSDDKSGPRLFVLFCFR